MKTSPIPAAAWALTALGFALLTVGHGMGLFVAPAEAMMGDVGRILYAHVPTAWVALVIYLVAFISAIGALATGRWGWDAAVEASAEVGVVLNALLLIQGSLWAKPTWGIYWDWDPRLTTTAVMLIMFAVVLLLRRVVTDPTRRLTVTGVATICSFANVPIVYMSVKWWRTLHQPWSSPETVDSAMVLPLRIAAFGMLFIGVGLVWARQRTILAALQADVAEPDMPELPPALELTAESAEQAGPR